MSLSNGQRLLSRRDLIAFVAVGVAGTILSPLAAGASPIEAGKGESDALWAAAVARAAAEGNSVITHVDSGITPYATTVTAVATLDVMISGTVDQISAVGMFTVSGTVINSVQQLYLLSNLGRHYFAEMSTQYVKLDGNRTVAVNFSGKAINASSLLVTQISCYAELYYDGSGWMRA